jgi:hypothetical protein
MHPPALDMGLALDPAEDVTALLVDPEPARRGVEPGALEPEEDVARELRIRARRPVHRVADANDQVVGRAAGERGLALSRG